MTHVDTVESSIMPRTRPIINIAVSALLIVACVWLVGQRIDFSVSQLPLRQLSFGSIAGIVVMLVIGAFWAALRLRLIARDLGYAISMRDSIAALGLGQVGGTMFFQIAGQLAARGAYLKKRHVPVAGSVLMVGYERVAALIVSLVLAAAGAVFIFGKISFKFADGASFVRILIGLGAVGVTSALLVWGHLVWPFVRNVSRQNYIAFGRCILISLGIQLANMAAYLFAAYQLAPTVDISDLAAAFTLVMFAASLPISFAGWGVREMSAISALGVIGVPPEYSFTIAIIVGALSLIVAFGCAAVAIWSAPSQIKSASNVSGCTDYNRMLDGVLPVLASMGVLFQILVPTEHGFLNVNLADPIALLAGALFLIRAARGNGPRWILPGLTYYAAVATAALLTAFAIGYFSFGWSQWAAVNKLFGWLVLLSFGATGATIVMRFDRVGLDVLLRTFVVSVAALIVMDIGLTLLGFAFPEMPRSLIKIPIEGLSQNRNAFAFLMLMAVSITLSKRSLLYDVLSVIFAVGLWLGGSRAGIGAGALVAVLSIPFRAQSIKSLSVGAVLAASFVLILPNFGAIPGYGGMNVATVSEFKIAVSSQSSDMAHLETMKDGLYLFLHHPIFGAGLGAYLAGQPDENTSLIIHSSPLWLLAETGPFGLLAFTLPFIAIFSIAIRNARSDYAMLTLGTVLASFAIMSSVHELLYQRCMWLLLGALLVKSGSTGRSDDVAVSAGSVAHGK